VKKKITSMKSNSPQHSPIAENQDQSAQGTEEEFELEISTVQRFGPTASGPNRNINPRAQREYSMFGWLDHTN
jgi:hypothetical protein